jgi:excisionase family DNA binding protein
VTASPPRYSAEWLRALRRGTVTPAEAGRVLGTTPRNIIRLVDAGELEGFRLGRRYRVTVAALLELISPP